MTNCNRKRQNGQATLEGALVLIPMIAILVAIFDVTNVYFMHQLLTERARKAARWGAVQSAATFSTIQSSIQNVVLCGKATCNGNPDVGSFGLQRSSVLVSRTMHTTPDDTQEWRLNITISGFNFSYLSWFASDGAIAKPIQVAIPYEPVMARQ